MQSVVMLMILDFFLGTHLPSIMGAFFILYATIAPWKNLHDKFIFSVFFGGCDVYVYLSYIIW